MSYLYSMLKTTLDTVVDCTAFETLSGINIDCNVPEGHQLFFAFQIVGKAWQKYDLDKKAWTDIADDITEETVAEKGNTLDEVRKFDRAALFPFLGNKVGYAIVSKLDQSKPGVPVIRDFSFVDDSVPCGDAITMNQEEPVEILDISPDLNVVGSGRCEIVASIQGADDKWSVYRDYHEYLTDQTFAKAIKFRAVRSVKTVGKDSVTIRSISVVHRRNNKKGSTTSVCVTKAFSFPHKISNVHLILKHPKAEEVKFKPSVSFKNAETGIEKWLPLQQDEITGDSDTKLLSDEFDYAASAEEAGSIVTLRVDMIGDEGSVKDQVLGAGTGAVTTYKLDHGAIRKTIAVSPADATWAYNAKKRTIDITAPAGTAVSISYDWESDATYLDSMSCVFSE